ncbi:MAG: NAD(P)-dependent glycerol-3-phosphate dehydrogenase [Rhodobacteraceae bacterium]|nr:NAD(P)-dependent glycerol-3-phosphate dehydrogenase [Paracoccaceae bacterium]
MSRIGVIGAGAFGTALACAMTRAGRGVVLWGRDRDQVDQIAKTGLNQKYLPGQALPKEIHPTNDLDDLRDISALLMVIPAQKLRQFLTDHDLSHLTCPIALCAKGVESGTGLLQSQIVTDFFSDAPVAAISGPGFAAEISAGKPTALSVACEDQSIGRWLQGALSSEVLRLYLTEDLKGVQLGGALKNVYAIACGIAVGSDLGESARAALMTRGFAEMSRLASSIGAKTETLSGLSGLGDLALSCTSTQSRNFAFGEKLGRSGAFGSGKTVEGIATARATTELAETQGVDMPVANVVADVLERNLTIKQALAALMSRPLKTEV